MVEAAADPDAIRNPAGTYINVAYSGMRSIAVEALVAAGLLVVDVDERRCKTMMLLPDEVLEKMRKEVNG